MTADKLRIGLFLLFAGFVGVFFYLLAQVGMTYPPPWPDEATFIWQSIAVQENNTLFSPELNPLRDVMWMPPGYMIITGLIFKVTGFSLEIARLISALCMVATMALIFSLVQSRRAGLWMILLLCLFLLGDRILFAANLARMETLTLLVACLGIVLVAQKKWYLGLAILAITPLIHPNGLHFCLPAGLYALWQMARRNPQLWPRGWDYLWMLGALICWGVYAAYVAANWEYFVSDMQFQLQFKGAVSTATGGFLGLLQRPHSFFPLIIVVLCLPLLRGVAARFFLMLSVALLSLNLVSLGMMYGIFETMAMCAASVLVLMLIERLMDHWRWERRIVVASFALTFLVLVSLQIYWQHLRAWPLAAEGIAFGMVEAHPGEEWITQEEHDAIRQYLKSIASTGGEPTRVMIVPLADGLFFHEENAQGIRLMANTFHREVPDVAIFHTSALSPEKLSTGNFLYLLREIGDVKPNHVEVIYERGEGNSWTTHDFRPSRIQAEGVPEQ